MEKLMYLACFSGNESGDSFREQQMPELAKALLSRTDVHELRLQIDDSVVAAAAGRRMAGKQACITPGFVASLWVDSANCHRELEAVLADYAGSFEGYLVCESMVLDPGAKPGQRTEGSAQVVSFRALPQLARHEFIENWRGKHTAVAVDTQSTFGYRQNLVVMPLAEDATPCSAIVEEHFPLAAMNSDEVFYDAVGDAEKLRRHQQQMVESCSRFIDFDSINVVQLSEYLFR